MQKAKVVVIASEGLTTNLLVERLAMTMEVSKVFITSAESKKTILKRRLKRLGFFQTAGQVFFLTLILPFIGKRKKRIASILKTHKLSGKNIDASIIQPIDSVHDEGLIDLIKSENPSIIVINGTRILKKSLLEKITCPIINIHVGITPKYRGVHGGYWAVRNKDIAHFGVTLHYVDTGIDTGKIIAQKIIQPAIEDNFNTYPILQYCAGLDLLTKHSHGLIDGSAKTIDALATESKLYYHPTFLGYLFGRK